MIALILVGVVLVGVLCVLAFTLATYALPFMLGLAAARFVFATGAGVVGACLVGLAVGVVSFAVLESLFSRLRSPVLRGIVMIVFVAPAAVAGYSLVHGLVRPVMPSEVWRQVFCLIGGASVGVSAWPRLASSHDRFLPLATSSAGHRTPDAAPRRLAGRRCEGLISRRCGGTR